MSLNIPEPLTPLVFAIRFHLENALMAQKIKDQLHAEIEQAEAMTKADAVRENGWEAEEK